jgi:hypothetical protein
MTTAVISVRQMLSDMIRLDTGLDALLAGKKVYTAKAPPNSPMNYVVLGQTTETSQGAGYYHQPGHQGTEEIHCWAKSKWTAQLIFARLSELLDGQRPVVTDHVVMKGVLDYVTDVEGEDVDGKGKNWMVWARYRVRSLVRV